MSPFFAVCSLAELAKIAVIDNGLLKFVYPKIDKMQDKLAATTDKMISVLKQKLLDRK